MTYDDPLEIGILRRDPSMLGTVHGLTDLFEVADRVACQRAERVTPMLRVRHLVQDGDGLFRPVDCVGGTREPAIVIVPPRQTIALGMAEDAAGRDWLRARHAAGATVASICGGVFLLAQAGLLDGRTVTTHWACAENLAKSFPATRVDADRLTIDDGDVITAGGMLAWIDLGLIIVERLLGRAVMLETARFMVIDPPGRDQRFYRKFLPRLDHGDHAVLLAQQRLERHGAGGVTVSDMARWARLEDRTFVRRFHKAVGLRPNEYCQRLRVEKARELLEGTIGQIGAIAQDVGYADPASFRKIFTRITGLSPGAYRKRFGRLHPTASSELHIG